MSQVKVSKALVDLLEEMANAVLTDEDHRRDWLDECQTSKLSNSKGGVIRFETNHDWKLALIIWYYGKPATTRKLPRER